MNDIELLLAQDAGFLVSFWKPILIAIPVLGWAWLVSAKLDKDAKYHYFNQRMWNGIHMAAAAIGLACMLLIPLFFVGYPVGLLLMSSSIFAYWYVRNQEVPAHARFELAQAMNISEWMQSRKQAKATRQAVIRFTDVNDQPRTLPDQESPLHEVHLAAEDFISPSLSARASRVDIALSANGAKVTHTVDGVRYKNQPLSAELGAKVIEYLMDIAGMDTSERRRRQTGVFELAGPTGTVKVNAVSFGSSNAHQFRMDFDREQQLLKSIDTIGLLPSQLELIRKLDEPEYRHGIVLVGAPAGQGLTTTCYSLLQSHDAYTTNIKTLELEIEAPLEGVDQTEWSESAEGGTDYATHLQSILRRDPDIVLTAPVRDPESAVAACQPGIEGPLMYVPQRLGTIEEQVSEWVKRVGDVKMATKPLRAVMNQRLVRTLCPNCRQPYKPSAEQLRKLNLPADKVKQLYQKTGQVQVKNKIENCPICGGTGYLNQTGIFEFMMIDDEMRKLLMAGDLKAARAQARRNKMVYMHEAALQKVLAGETTLEELVRVTSASKPDGGKSAPSKADAATVT